MRKILLSVIVCLLLIGSAFFMVNGLNAIEVQGFVGLDKKNKEVEQKISDLSDVISVKYENTSNNLKKSANTLMDSKTEYETQAILSESNRSSYASQLELYDIDYLWTKLGNFAKDENCVIKIEVTSAGASKKLYNLKFTVSGSYVGITDFIYDIEIDSKLGFKIDDFSMEMPADTLYATFTCKDIPIELGELENATPDTSTNNTQGNTTNTNTTNSTTTTTNTTTNTTTTTSNTTNTSDTTSNSNTSINDMLNRDY